MIETLGACAISFAVGMLVMCGWEYKRGFSAGYSLGRIEGQHDLARYVNEQKTRKVDGDDEFI